MTNIFKIIVIVLVIAIVAAGGYYVYMNYFTGGQQEVRNNTSTAGTVAAAKGPRATYIEFMNKIEKANTLEEAFNITIGYGYFATPVEKEEATTGTTAEIQKMTAEQKSQQLKFMKDMFQEDLDIATKLTETIDGDNATIRGITADGSEITVNMIKDGGVWKLTQ